MAYLGPPRFEFGVAELEDQVGAVTGVAVNEYGGDGMTGEAILMQGRGEFSLTGQIGKGMEESARAPVSYARSPKSEEHTSELPSQSKLVCRLLLVQQKT